MVESHTKKSSIIDYWHAVELFSPQSVPILAPNDADEPVYPASVSFEFPWDPLSIYYKPQRSAKLKTSWRYYVYAGIFDVEKMKKLLEDKFGKDPESFDERPCGDSCLFAFSVAEDGRPLFDTFVLSGCAWATGRTIKPGPDKKNWLTGFHEIANKAAATFAENCAVHQNDVQGIKIKEEGFNIGRILKYNDILTEANRIAQNIGMGSFVGDIEVRVKRGLIASRKKYSPGDQDFLNSYFLNDLAKVSHKIQKKSPGKGLSAFLLDEGDLDTSKRINVRNDYDSLLQQLSPALFPSGRWPGKGHHPLVFGQQFAINSMTKDFMKGAAGLFAVNGPPGTGKTTLLRDLIAAIVVERATRLSELAQPEDAFSGNTKWESGKFTRVVSLWKEQFKGFEIVVASYNNGAVENVTMEIPGQDAIDPSWSEVTDYFPDYASRLIDQQAWAMMAARLGNMSNRKTFNKNFWFEDKNDDSAKEEKDKITGEKATPTGFQDLLKSYEAEETPANWGLAVANYKKTLEEERRLSKERESIFVAYEDIILYRKELKVLEAQLNEYERCFAIAAHEFDSDQNKKKVCFDDVGEVKENRLDHRKYFPPLFEIIISLGKSYFEWKLKDKTLESLICAAELKLADANIQIISTKKKVESAQELVRQALLDLNQKQKTIDFDSDKISGYSNKYHSYLPVPEDWHNEEHRELTSPWADPEWNNIRAKLFLDALELHKSFIVANAGTIRKNLQVAMDILLGEVPDGVSQKGVESAWATLFFVIPVISTTFASFDRLFAHLGQESIGWLLIDEAGQAVPQSAVGAIWRSKRTIAVGDPLQLEPVVTIPFTVQQALRKHFNVEKTWVPGKTSVQRLADRVSLYGTYMKGENEPNWVGSPLRVHRRCDQPMFDISNKVAYEGLMVYGTPPRSSLELPHSDWIDVKCVESKGHWIPAEGAAVEELLNSLILNNGVDTKDIFLISPFRDVVKHLYIIADKFDGIKAGTIHTVQGKESEIVILVLGGDPKRAGAKKWASERPNLLNVAVSRARRRLYVVGNRNTWKGYPFFSVCDSVLRGLYPSPPPLT